MRGIRRERRLRFPALFRSAQWTWYDAQVGLATRSWEVAMIAETPGRDPYLIKSVVHSSQLLAAFQSPGEALTLREIVARSGLPKSMAFRLLYTLERCGMVEKAGRNLYRSALRPVKQRRYKLGYAAQGTDYQFSKRSRWDFSARPPRRRSS